MYNSSQDADALGWVRHAVDEALDTPSAEGELGIPRNALALLQRLSEPSELVALLTSVVADSRALSAVGADSFHHVLGFDKLILYSARPRGQLRLHVWWPGDPRRREHIHNHRFTFSSAVVTGSLRTHFYVSAEDGKSLRHFVESSDPRDRRWRFDEVGRTTLAETLVANLPAGTAYTMAPGMLHHIDASPGLTATVFLETESTSPSSSVFVQPGDEEPRAGTQAPMDPAELAIKLRQLCSYLSA